MANPESSPLQAPDTLERHYKLRARESLDIVHTVVGTARERERLVRRIKPNESEEKVREYYKEVGKHAKAIQLGNELDRAVTQFPERMSTIPLDDNFDFIERIIDVIPEENMPDIKFGSTYITEGCTEAVDSFLENFAEPQYSLLPWTRNVLQQKKGQADERGSEFVTHLPTKVQGVACEYRYAPDHNTPIRSIVIFPFSTQLDSL